jgi:hypothetical protein
MNIRKPSTATRRMVRGGLLALGLAAVAGSTLAPAFAGEWRHDRDDRRVERTEHARIHYVRHGYREETPRYGYNYGYVAPGYARAPVYGYAAPALTLGFSFR